MSFPLTGTCNQPVASLQYRLPLQQQQQLLSSPLTRWVPQLHVTFFLRSSILAGLELGLPRTPFMSVRAVALQDGHPRRISQTNWIILITPKMAAIAAETCWWEFSEYNTSSTMKRIFLVVYILWIWLMHGRRNIKSLIRNRQKLHTPERIKKKKQPSGSIKCADLTI